MGHDDMAQEIRATVQANRTGRPPRKGAKTLKRGTRGLITVLALGMIVATIATSASLAGKCDQGNNPHCASSSGGGGSTSGGGTISLVLLNSTDGLPHVGQDVTFDVSTTATDYPWVTVYCSQSGSLVYKASDGIFPTSLDQVFTLASNSWISGDADCTAWLQNWDNYAKHGTVQNLASMDFHVYA